MEAEIISIGTEIVLGQIVNTNARFLADQLRRLDIDILAPGAAGKHFL